MKIYDGRLPILMVTDLEMIKAIMVKECYSTFTNRRETNAGLAGPFADGITVVKDERWKRIRSSLSPYFTSGRLKEIFPIAVTHADRFIKNMQKRDHEQPVKVKEVVAPYSLDVVTSSSFSVDIDSINNADDPFVTNVKKFFKFSLFSPLILILALFPSIANLLGKMGISIFSRSSVDFFYNVLRKIKDEHNKESNGRVDFLKLMIQNQIPDEKFEDTSDQPVKGLTDHEILSQSFVFILGGYETTSTTLTYLLYNLATNPECLEKLVLEIDTNFPPDDEHNKESDGRVDFLKLMLQNQKPGDHFEDTSEQPAKGLKDHEILSQSLVFILGGYEMTSTTLTYLLYNLATNPDCLEKLVVEIDTNFPPHPSMNQCVSFPLQHASRGIPTYVLCRDPQLWESPDEFRPERFCPECKSEMNQYAFLPFGLGPRNCIVMRFAQMIMKLLVLKLLQNFRMETCKETQIPLEMNAAFQPKVPITVKFMPRSRKEKK
ncbi:cytochrome P450 3A40-like [Sinocyclocheilus anshuiensis]|uniref:cytochrome P450 3A40-like n=1 Tax=Sinocyclocheilus anshuiensis TaxID=1608454 RepID=UPI0007B7C5BE|nr:PREDICTED: cytochrome P450 3A40-like [Sinocyclocheilus anshuiensis]